MTNQGINFKEAGFFFLKEKQKHFKASLGKNNRMWERNSPRPHIPYNLASVLEKLSCFTTSFT
jgi:hypothetical protein